MKKTLFKKFRIQNLEFRINFKIPKRQVKLILIFVFFFGIFSWKIFGENRELTIFVSTDLHGYISTKDAGILKIATILKKEVPLCGGHEKCLIVDCGDFSQGSIDASLSKGLIIFKLLNALKYDAVVPGNHEFDYGIERFLSNTKQASFKILCGNLTLSNSSDPFKGWAIFQKNGVRIAVIGMTYPGMTDFEKGKSFFYNTENINTCLAKILPEILLQKVDLIVLAVHGGLYNGWWSLQSVGNKFPEIDIILAGHTHEAVPGKMLNDHVYFLQAGCHAEYLGKIVVTIDTQTHKKKIVSQLIPTLGVKDDTELEKEFKSPFSELKQMANNIIATSQETLNLSKCVSVAMQKETNSDIAIYGLAESSVEVKGPIKYKDIFKAVPYEDCVATMLVNETELKTIMQELYKYAKKKKEYKEMLFSGFKIKMNKKSCITNISFDNSSINEKKIRLAFSSYYVEYPNNKFPEIRKIAKQKNSEYKNTHIAIRDSLIKYIQDRFYTL